MSKRALTPFDEVAEGTLEARKILSFRQDTVRSQATGREMQVDRVLAPDWVNVVALAGDDLLCVRQWRFGASAFTLEVPAGIVEPGEDPLAAGLRELLEETGYAPSPDNPARLLGSVRTNPAFMNNRCFTVLVEDAVWVSELALDEHEEIEVVRLPRAQLDPQVRDGTFDTAFGLVALHWFALYSASR